MKTIKLIAVLFLFFCSALFSQNLWQNQVDINFTIQSNTKVSSFADENGIHIVYSRNGGVRYALVNSEGSIIKYDKVIKSESSGADYANVVADGNNVYAIYYKNNDIKVAKSTNLGNNWNTSFSDRPLVNTGCNKIVAYKDGDDIRITWSEKRTGSSYIYDVHYIKFTPEASPNPDWSEYKRVSEDEYDGGENPDLAISPSRVHVDYTSSLQPKNRDRLTTGWDDAEDVPYHQIPLTNQIKGIKPLITGSNLNVIYVDNWGGWQTSGVYIGHTYRSFSGTTWYKNQTTLTTDMLDATTPYPHVANNTADGKIHLIYWDKDLSYFAHRSIDGTTVSDVIAEIDIYDVSNNLIANSNDLYLVYTNNHSTPGKIKFRHYDDDPLAPQNLDYSVSGNNHPLLEWDANQEADIDHYEIWKKTLQELGFVHLTSTSNNYYEDETETFPVKGGPGYTHNVWYYVKAVDVEDNVSDASNTLTVNVAGAEIQKKGQDDTPGNVPEMFALFQNYSNPFNPSTQISYSLAEDADVSIKVYDMLGTEVANLINDTKPAGQYEINFNAENLASGVYIYRITASKNGRVLFTNSKQMILLR